MTKTLAILSCLACMLGGCTIHRICPPIQGTVVDANVGTPIKGAKVEIKYWQSERVTRTDSEGRFGVGAKYKVFPLFPLNLNRILGCHGLHVEAVGYEPTDMFGPHGSVHSGTPLEFLSHKATRGEKGELIVEVPMTPLGSGGNAETQPAQ